MTQLSRIILLIVVTLTYSTATVAQSSRAAAPAKRVFPQLNLPGKANGEQALANLGSRSPEVAQWYGMTTAEFARTLREDKSAWIDARGRMLYIDAAPEFAEADDADSLTEGAPFPASETFFLNSRPSAKRTLFLDFDGHTISGRVWNGGNTVVSPPYDRDGDINSFNSQEIEYIQAMWRQVAEDYAPFDVNVTTQDPGQDAITRSDSNDQFFGTRVVITADNFLNCGCGGYAYLRVFDDVGDYYKPAFVFNTSLAGAGEAISHEAGHNLGLSHDGSATTSYYTGHGSGDTGWAPIMGAGYYQKLVQWSKGEYMGANQTQDDFQLIQNYGAPLAADDHGDISAAATTLEAVSDGSNLSVTGTGVIQHRDDLDVFRIVSGAGSFSVQVSPAAVQGNLDILARLSDSQGNIVASSNPLSSLSASLSGTSLPAGVYFLAIDGVGAGDPLATGYTDYGSLGHYSINGSFPLANGLVAPVARLSAAPLAGYAPLTVDFDGSASSDTDGNITDHDWNFGDGSFASGSNASNVYYGPGDYTASLQVTDDSSLSNTASVNITVYNQQPIAVASADTSSGSAPVTVDFQGSASSDPDAPYGDIVSWQWSFGDGGSSSQADPSYTYNTAGDFSPSLTVTDDQGGTSTVTLSVITIAGAAYSNHYAHAEIIGAGPVTGTIDATYADDGYSQSVNERISGGKKSTRYSYLEHSWLVSIPQANMTTLHLNAWHSAASDGDSMVVDLSTDGGNSFQRITTLASAGDNGSSSFMLPAGTQGEVHIRMQDTNRSAGQQAIDTVYVDELYIRTENSQGGTPPASPSNFSVNGNSGNSLDLSWTDSASSEYGYVLARSVNNGPWDEQYRTLGENVDSFTDTGLSAATTYIYRVAAYNGAGNSGWSNQDSATTADAPVGELLLSVAGFKQRGVQHATLLWSGASTALVDVYRDLQLVATVANTGSYTDNIGSKGGGSYSYEVCNQGTNTCTNAALLPF